MRICVMGNWVRERPGIRVELPVKGVLGSSVALLSGATLPLRLGPQEAKVQQALGPWWQGSRCWLEQRPHEVWALRKGSWSPAPGLRSPRAQGRPSLRRFSLLLLIRQGKRCQPWRAECQVLQRGAFAGDGSFDFCFKLWI